MRPYWGMLVVLALVGCGGGGGADNGSDLKAPQVVYDPPMSSSPLLPSVDGTAWDETAVRKVLHVFAFGGFASDRQIRSWANMQPQAAIVEMLTFDSYNPKLSPTVDADVINSSDRSLQGLSALWSSDRSPAPADMREWFAIESWNGPMRTATLAAGMPGINPVPHRITLWELNYHLVANVEADVWQRHIAYYYDTVRASLAARDPYQKTLALAAESVAIAQQYKHFRNFYDIGDDGLGIFSGNEDFAREFHQLFFGILGTRLSSDLENNYHEVVTIKNTAKLLTDMTVVEEDDLELTFGTARHHAAPLEIMHRSIAGETARDKIRALAEIDIRHPESLDNLPVMIISGLANDNLTAENMAELRAYWASMVKKDLLQFLRAYAISQQFHSPERVKHWTAFERNRLYANLLTHNQLEAYADFYDAGGITEWQDGYRLFAPEHNVFGHTTGLETNQSGDRFRLHFNRGSDESWRASRTQDERYPDWRKDWGRLAPRDAEGVYHVDKVAEWLWQRFLADGHKNFHALERLHVYAMLAHDLDPAVACAPDRDNPDYDKIYSQDEAEHDPAAQACLASMAAQTLALDSDNPDERREANSRIGHAISFLMALPYAMMQEGR